MLLAALNLQIVWHKEMNCNFVIVQCIAVLLKTFFNFICEVNRNTSQHNKIAFQDRNLFIYAVSKMDCVMNFDSINLRFNIIPEKKSIDLEMLVPTPQQQYHLVQLLGNCSLSQSEPL
jgi:hypothetical protein